MTATPWNELEPLPGEVGSWFDDRIAARLRGHLAAFTAHTEPCVQALWEGHGELGGGAILVRAPRKPLRRAILQVGCRLRRRYGDRDGPTVPIPRLLPEQVERDAAFAVPHRTYYAFAATLDDLRPRPWRRDGVDGDGQSADLFWPTSRCWIVATDVDLIVTFVGGPPKLIEALTGDPHLGASPVSVEQELRREWTDLED